MTWIDTLLEDESTREQAAREFTLRALRRGSDPLNHWIIRMAHEEQSIAVAELEQQAGVTKSTVSERVNDLVQVGLLERNLEGDMVQPTVLTAGFIGVVDDVADRFAQKIAEGFDADRA